MRKRNRPYPKQMKPLQHRSRNYLKALFSFEFWKQKKIELLIIAIIFGIIGSTLFIMSRAAITDEILFPADANITNVKSVPYSAKGDGVTDDTQALRQAITSNDAETAVFRSSPKTVYIPKGTYLITDSIIADNSSVRIVGAGQGQTIIKLKDGASGFNDSNVVKYVLKSGNYNQTADLANSGFSNYFQDFTVDVGSNNPGAVGIRHDVANTGAMQRVTVKAGTNSGKYGVSFETSAGPALVQDVTVEGFEYGVYLDNSNMNVLTFEDLTTRNQRKGGILNDSKNIVLENFVSQNNPKAVETINSFAAVMVMGATLNGQGSGPAINMPVKGFLHVRDVTASSFANLISVGGTAKFVGKTALKEWSTENYRVGNSVKQWTEDNDYVSLHLPIKKAPTYTSNDFTKWASVKSFGATAGLSETDAANNDDDGPAIQRAIDSGAEVIYFPYGFYTVKTNIVVRGNVKKIDFFFSRIASGGKVTISIEAVAGDTVILENVSSQVPFVHKSPDTVVIRNINSTGGGISTDVGATGDLFSENNGSHAHLDINQPINVWVRSMDRTNVDWTNKGGTLWALSTNVESDESHTISTSGAKTEMFGGTLDSLYTLHPASQGAVFQSENSFMSVFMPGTLRSSSTAPSSWDYLLHDSYATGVTDVYNSSLTVFPATKGFDAKFVLPLYVTPGYVQSSPTGDSSSPTVQLTAPTNGATIYATANLTASATDNTGVTKVEFVADGVVVGSDTTSPYSASWNTSAVTNGSHSLIVKAYDAAGNIGTATATITVKNGDATAPSAPLSLTVKSAAYNKVNLAWTASTDNVGVSGYWVVRNGVTIAQLGPTTTYTDATATASTSYAYQVKAFDAAGNTSAASNTASVTTPAASDTQAPSVPVGLVAAAVSTSQINLAWTASTDNLGVTGYDVYRNGTKIASVATSTSFGDAGLTASTNYSYFIKAKDAAGNTSGQSSTVSATTQAPVVKQYSVIGGTISATDGATISGAKVTITINGTKSTATTDSVGKYRLDGLLAGTYSVKYSSSKGYEAQILSVNVPSGSVVTRNVVLNRR